MIIKKTDCTKEVIAFMSVPNEKYYSALKRGVPNFFMQPSQFLGYRDFMPPGAAYWTAVKTKKPLPLPPLSIRDTPPLPFKLRDKQIPIVELAKSMRAGLIQLNTGGGKSVILVALTYIWGESALILVHKKDMVEQFYNVFKDFLGWEIGRLNSDHKDVKPITVTTFDSAKLRQNELIDKGFKTLFIDEADAFFTPPARKFITQFPAKRIFSFTATTETPPDKFMKPGEIPAIERFYGYKIKGETQSSVLKEIKYTYFKRAPYVDDFGIPILPQSNWTLFRKKLDEDLDRKKFIMKYILSEYKEGDRALVLFDRINHVIEFKEKCPIKKKYIIYGATKKAERALAKKEFLANGGIMFSQYQTSSRGVDYPECNKIFLLFPMKGETLLRQAIGRTTRKIKGKISTVYDMEESLLTYQWNARMKTYKKYYKTTPLIPL